MDIIRKMITAALTCVICTTLCSCSTVKKAKIDSGDVTDNPALSEPVVITTKDVITTQKPNSDDEFSALDLQEISDGDKETMTALCNLMCHKWAKSYNTKQKDYYTGLVNNSNFVKYLNLTASNVTLMGIPYSSDASFTFESMTSDGNFATLTGSYISPSGGYGKFTFIVENVKGRFFVNDMYYDSAPDMVDKLVRPEFINSPTPNYWQNDENLAVAERILTAVQ